MSSDQRSSLCLPTNLPGLHRSQPLPPTFCNFPGGPIKFQEISSISRISRICKYHTLAQKWTGPTLQLLTAPMGQICSQTSSGFFDSTNAKCYNEHKWCKSHQMYLNDSIGRSLYSLSAFKLLIPWFLSRASAVNSGTLSMSEVSTSNWSLASCRSWAPRPQYACNTVLFL